MSRLLVKGRKERKLFITLKKEIMGYRTTFYYETKDGKQYDFHTQHCYRPTSTKAWKKLKRMLNEYNDVYKISYRIGDYPMFGIDKN